MAALSIQVPYPVFYDRDGQPLDNGNIYIGVANLDPVTNPLQVYYDETLTITASQPLITSGGYVYRNGTPTQLYVNANDFSITVNDSKNLFVYSFPEATGIGVGAATIEYQPPFTGAVTSGYTVQDKLSQTVSVIDFGAVGDGVADDTAAIQAAEAAAFAIGAVLEFPAGIYLQDGPRTFRCSISGYGATIKNIIGSEQQSLFSGLVRFDAETDLFVAGLTVDGNDYSNGFNAQSNSSRITYSDCTAINCIIAGFNAYYCSEISYINCKAINIKYDAVGLDAADGFYAGACLDMSYLNCSAENFERIGFVSDVGGVSQCFRPRYVSCLAKNGNNCDLSLAQYNAGFWMEQTNGAVIDDCTVLDIGGNAGQTSGRVIGIVIAAVGDTEDHISVLSNTTIGDSTGTLPVGISINGSANSATVIVNNVRVNNYNVGISVLRGIDTAIIDNVTLTDGVYSQANFGGVLLNIGGGFINKVSCSNVVEVNANYTNTDAGTINVFDASGTGARGLYIDRVDGTLVMRNAMLKTFVSNSNISCRTANYRVVAGVDVFVSSTNFIYLSGNGSVFSNAVSTAVEQYVNCRFNGFSSGLNTFVCSQLLMDNCIFTDSQFKWGISNNNTTLKMSNCLWKMSTATECWYGNFYNVVKDTVIIQNCTFYTTATYAVKQWNVTPDYLVLQGNTYSSANLTDMVPTSAVNNVATP
jgi:hypothetical protein